MQEIFVAEFEHYEYGALKTATIYYNSYRPEPDSKTAQAISVEDITKTYGEQAFSLGAKTSGDGELSYTVSNPKVAVVDKTGTVIIRSCGITDITVAAAETRKYTGAQKVIKLTVKPKKMSLKFVKSKKKKIVTVKWKKDTAVSGYLLECTTDKKFKKNKIQKTSNRAEMMEF